MSHTGLSNRPSRQEGLSSGEGNFSLRTLILSEAWKMPETSQPQAKLMMMVQSRLDTNARLGKYNPQEIMDEIYRLTDYGVIEPVQVNNYYWKVNWDESE